MAPAIAAVLLAGGCGGSEGDRSPQPRGGAPAGRSAPARAVYPSPYANLYVVDTRTHAVSRLTHNDDDQVVSGSSWSKSGQIVFTQAPSDEDPAHLFVIGEGASKARRVRTRLTQVVQPTWAPDGRRVGVVKLGVGIYTVGARSGEVATLTHGQTDAAPAWSPDGRSVAFERQVTATNWDLFTVEVKNQRVRRVTHDGLQQVTPAWSPDGRRIAYSQQQEGGNWAIFSRNKGGSDARQLTSDRQSTQQPAWSPDGREIAVVRQNGGDLSIAVMPADGGSPVRLTTRRLICRRPAWSPDGRKILFVANRALSRRDAAEHGD